jgi:hypothetical protein
MIDHCHTGGMEDVVAVAEAAESPDAPYFYEAFLAFASHPAPSDEGYPAWKAGVAERMEAGRDIWYCGQPA